MIIFSYFCNEDKHHSGCGHEFEVLLDKDERMQPLNEKCPECGKEGNVCRKFSSKLFRQVIHPHAKMDDNFKEHMRRIHKEHNITSNHF